MSQTFFTALEIAGIARTRGIASWPHSESASIRRIRREGWPSLPSNLTRPRLGREGGGGMEYHFSLLPPAMQAAVADQRAQLVLAARHDVECERDRRQVEAIRMSALSAQARAVMGARAEILTAIDGFAISKGETRAWSIGQFIEALDAYATRQEIERRRDAGEFLTPREAASLAQRLALTAVDGFQIEPSVVITANDRKASCSVTIRHGGGRELRLLVGHCNTFHAT